MVDYNLSGYRDNLVLNIAGLGLSDDENNNREVLPTRVKQDPRDLRIFAILFVKLSNLSMLPSMKMYCSTLK